MDDEHLSVRRLATKWVAGLTVSWLLIFGPPEAGRVLLERCAHALKGWGGYAERQEIGRVADEQWVARQRAAGPAARTSAGEPAYAIVRARSAPPPELREKMERSARMAHRTMLAWGLLIPVLLVLTTRNWVRGRRRLAELERYPRDALGRPRQDERPSAAMRRHARPGKESRPSAAPEWPGRP